MYLSAGALALIVFLVFWLVLGQLLWGIILALVILACSGGIGYSRRMRPPEVMEHRFRSK